MANDKASAVPGNVVRVPNFRDQAVGLLREMIVSGRFETGSRLNEVEIAQLMGISRGPVREAIQRLVAEGLVKVIPNLGSFVMSLTEPELRELYEFRTIVEVGAARLAAERATDEELAELRELLDETGQEFESTTSGAYPEAFDLHRRILELAGNQPLLMIFRKYIDVTTQM